MAKIHNPQDQNGVGLINQTVFDEEHALRVAEETRLDGAIKSETTRATGAENTITTILNAEVTRSSEEDVRLDSAIKTETTRATGAENDIIETISSFAGENIVTETETLNSSERELIVGQIEQKFESSDTSPINVRGFGDTIQKSGQLKSIKIYCPSSSNTTQSVWLKVFEKTNNGNIFVGISDNINTHGQNETLLYTFEQSQINLYANKEYYFVFCTEDQKDLTVYYDVNHSVDCCLKCSNNSGTGGVLGSNGYSRTSSKPIYNIFLYKPVISSVEVNAHISDKNIHLSKSNFTNNLPEIAQDKLYSWGFMIKSPKSGSLKTVTSFCRKTGDIVGGETYLKVWNEANECIGCSVNKFAHSLDAVHEYIFENITLEKDSYYKFSYINDEEQKTTSDTNSNVRVCLKSTTVFPKAEVDQIFSGYSLNQSLDRQVLNNTSSVQIIIDINFFNDIEKLEKKISNNEENISAVGVDIDSINATIDLLKEPNIHAFNNEGATLNEIVVNLNEQISDISISYQPSIGVFFASNVIANSSYFTINKEASLIGPMEQDSFTIKFNDLSVINTEIKEYIIIDAIVAELDCSNCKHISRILPITFKPVSVEKI